MDGETQTQSKFKRVCVFCGSHSGNRTVFSDAALDLGNELVKRRVDLVYGGGSVGLMGLISQTVNDGGCSVLGVIPTALMPLEISGQTVGEVKIVADMHERKAEMARQSDAFIALPGGYGTMEELLEMITWSQLGIHNKPVGLLNVDGYYNSLLALFDTGVEEGFIKPGARHIVLSAPSAKELLTKMEQYTPRHQEVAPSTSWEIAHLGGYGTMEELLEMITWSQLGIHNKPVGLLNVDGYYNSLLALFDTGVEEGFIKPGARHIVLSAPSAKELLTKMEQYTPRHQEVAPSTSWEIAHLGYSTPPSPH